MSSYLFYVPFGISLLALCVAERLIHIFLNLFMRSHAKKEGTLGSQIVVGGVINLAAVTFSNVIAIFIRCLYAVGWIALWFLVLFSLSSLWYVLYEEYPGVVLHFVEFYNARIGPFVHTYLLLPLELFNVVFKGGVPLYNGALWILRSVASKGILPILWEQFHILVSMGSAFVSLSKHSTDSLVTFGNSFECGAGECLDKPAVLDLLTPMDDVRLISTLSSGILGAVCSVLAVPADLAMYPLRDLNFARGVHSMVNAMVHLVIHVPHSTMRRCKLFGGSGAHTDVLACTPDFEPVFTHFVSSLRDFGSALDNWMGIGASVARRSLTGVPDSCTSKTLSSDSFRADGMLTGVTTVVGMTDWLMAATNGSIAFFYGQVNADVAPRAWPEVVDVRMGVAAISYSDAGIPDISTLTQGRRPGSRQTTALLGCQCHDSDAGIRVVCTVLPVSSSGTLSAADSSMEVWFQDSAWASHMKCESVEISVRSVRWPVRRYEGKSVPFGAGSVDLPSSGDCLTQGTCESIDATIWLVPRCDLLPAEQCSDVAVGTSCFPFCVAARVAGSKNANPVFANAETWRNGKQLLMRDCALRGGTSAESAQAYDSFFLSRDGGASAMSFGQTTMSGASAGSPVFVRGDGSSCSVGVNMASWVPNAPGPVLPFVRRTGQPFAIAGDTILLEYPQSDGGVLVEVERLTGDQRDEYSLRKGWYGMPAAPKRMVPIQELGMDVRDRIVVPMEYVATRVVATSSRNFLFYAVNPDLQVFEAYLDYCRDRSNLPRIQLMALSSYGPLRVYRVRAYCQENCNNNWADLSAQFTFDSFSNGTFTENSFSRDCRMVYNASIDTLEYVNEQNIAVVVQVADRTYDVKTRSGTGSVYKTYWLNPRTMAVRGDGVMWTPEVPSSLSTSLCAAGDSVPHVGTLAAEVIVSGVHIANFALGAFVYSPGLILMWKGGGACPLASHGHSVLASCGDSVFDLDDYFDSIDDATAVFWGIPIWLSDQLAQGSMTKYFPVGNILHGMGLYGRESMEITDVMSMLKTPISDQVAGAWASVRNPSGGAMMGGAKIALGASSLSRYTTRLFKRVGLDMVKGTILLGTAMSASEIWYRFSGAMYDLRPMYKTGVTERAKNACLGLLVMLGSSSPWAKMVYHLCKVGPTLLDGAMDLVVQMFVDTPMVKCVCKDSAGHSVGAYAREYCVPRAPQTLKPTLLGMIAAAEGRGLDSLLCPAVIAFTREAMGASMKPWFESVYASLDALGDSVDYALVGFDEDAGQCMNFRQDPQVVVIMPEPVDYFQACGSTTMCQTRCAATWDAFSAEVAKRDPNSLRGVKEVQTSVESMFFPSPGVDIVAPGTIVALTQPNVCSMCRDASDGCLAVASSFGTALKVTYYCIPGSPSSSAYASDSQELNWASPVGYDASQIGFLDEDGGSLVALVGANLFLLERGVNHKVVVSVSEIYSLQLLSMYPMRIVDFFMVRDRVLVNVAVRISNGAEFDRTMATIWVDPRDGLFGWPVVVTQSMRGVWNGYVASEYPAVAAGSGAGLATMLLWPVTPGGFLQRVIFKYSNTSVEVLSTQPFQQGDSLVARASLMPKMLVLAKTLRVKAGQLAVYASSGSVYDWLQQLRLMGDDLVLTGSTLGNTQSVGASVSITTECNGLDCRGCPDLGLRALCASFQSCAVFRCIGTPVNLKRPLCGVGQVLRSTGILGVEMVHGGWIMFVDIYMILLQLSTQRNVPGVEVSFPEDAFLGNICAAKDISAEFFSIIASTVNSAMQMAQIPTVTLQNVAQVDSGANTMLSLSTAAVAGFLNQFALAPVYVLAIGYKMLMCEVSGMLAVTSSGGFHVDITPARFSGTNAIGGQCLTRGAEMDVMQTGDASSVQGVSTLSGALLTHDTGEDGLLRTLEPALHILDGTMAFFIGLTGKFADLLQTFDVRQCVLPDVTIKRTVQCACGDTALSILPARSREGLRDFAYWCTGTISLVDSSNKMRVVWNPYTYDELRGKLSGVMDAYVEAASNNVMVDSPNDSVFAEQGVSMIAVLTRCRQNYVNKQWDPAAFARYSQDAIDKEIVGGKLREAAAPGDGVGECLLESSNAGVGNGACLDSFLRERKHTPAYWGYSPTKSTAANHIDACLVFSGPASNESVLPVRRQVFQNCLAGYTSDGGCDLSGFVWSPASSNDVPVASRHVIAAAENEKLDAVGQRMAAARDMVFAELDKLVEYENADLEAAVFSAEGDVIHQLMDCVFMGPFARMDYWPGPHCNESDTPDCLVGPYWSRDVGGGATRKVDIETCPASNTLPFTCGSPARQAMVKDFVQRFLQAGQGGSAMLVELVRAWLADQRARWGNVSTYGCDCSGSPARNDVSCCSRDVGSPHLPVALAEIPLYLPTQSIMNAIELRMKQFYLESLWSPESWTSHLSDSEGAKYDWSNSAGSHRVVQEALFGTTNQTRTYTRDEAMSPPRNLGQPGIWQACHGALRQVLFTIPLAGGGLRDTSVPNFPGGGPDAIAAHVREIVKAAFDDSPLFRHYHPKHHPSESLMCERVALDDDADIGNVDFGDYRVNGNIILDGKRLAGIPVLGYGAAAVGSWSRSCFCGWRLRDQRCTVPAQACAEVSSLMSISDDCTYAVDAQDLRALESAFRPGMWKCPLLELSEHLGFLDPLATERWLRGDVNLSTSGEFLLRYGAGGLKVGNVPIVDGENVVDLGLGSDFLTGDLASVLRQYMTPSSRKIDPALGVLHGCREHEKLRASPDSFLVDAFVERLFPMAQGVSESGVGAYCLRFAVELSRLHAMELMQSMDHASMVRQKEVLSTWRRRCGSQVQLVGMCSALDVYHAGGMQPSGCMQPWQIVLEPSLDMYVTPQCLVKIGQFFYDPCACNPQWCEKSDVPVVIKRSDLQSDECRLKFDPRTVVREAELGWWGVDEADPAAAASNEWLAEPWNLLDLDRLRTSLLDEGQGVGNVPLGHHWATAEGFLNETGVFCDVISDYWPEDGRFPVGYHVTVPCDREDIGYRSFDNVFALDDGALVYMEDQTRDGDLVDSHLGAGGMCRGTNFGFEMYETNTMRVCTRTMEGEDVDIHVPKGENNPGKLGQPRCSASSTDLPWGDERYYDFYDAVFYSVGTVPNLPSENAKAYPETPDRYMKLGPQQDMETAHWGQECQDFVLPYCSTTTTTTTDGLWKCPAGYVCRSEGVCQHPSVECTRHDHCAGGKMCSGVGTCVTPRLTVENDLGSDASFRAHTTKCSGESFSMRGASSWGYVPDLLDSHGMCSYRHWQEYLYTIDKCRCSASDATKCTLNGTSCQMFKFSGADDNNMWWNPSNGYPNRLKMLPTTCDRDYERLSLNGDEMLSCVPSLGRVRIMDVDNTYQLSARRDRMWKLYDDKTKSISLRLMPFRVNVSFGFLGFSADPTLKSCTSVQQCFVDEFTKNGKTSMIFGRIARANRTIWSGAPYNPDHTFQCGVIGFFNASTGMCHIDRKLFPLYHLMCFGTVGLSRCLAATKLTDIDLARMCQNIIDPYPQQYNIIHDVNVPALAALFAIFRVPATLQQHFDTVGCMNYIYGTISRPPFESKGLYMPFSFTVYEVPFPWFYQCMVGSGIEAPQNLERVLQRCPFYESRNTIQSYKPPVDGRLSDFSSFVFNVRGGYNETSLRAQVNSQLATAESQWQAAVEEVRRNLYGRAGDRSYPSCYTQKRWALPSGNFYKLKLIETFERQSCSSNARSAFLERYKVAYSRPDLTLTNVIDELTVDAGPKLPQDSFAVPPLLTNRILNFGLSHLRKRALIENLDISVPPVRFDASLPLSTSLEYTLVRDQWKIASGYMPITVDIYNPIASDCVTDEARIQLFTGALADFDTDKQAGLSTRVDVCPIYATGRFGCGYEDITLRGVKYSLSGSSVDRDAAFSAFVDAMYMEAKVLYDSRMRQRTLSAFPLEPMSWYEDEGSLFFGSNFVFDLTRVVTFMNNIDPDVKNPTMCVAGNQTIDYNDCTDANFQALRSHVEQNYQKESGVLIPDRKQLDWDVSREMMSTGAIFSFASADRETSKQYLGKMFDAATVCQARQLSHSQRLCSFSGSGVLQVARSVSPWMSGNWNPYDQCDVTQMSIADGNTEKIDVECHYNAYCPEDRPFDLTVPYYRDMPYGRSCIARNDEKTKHINVDSKSPYNLCQHLLVEDSVCQHTQGMLGGTDGMPSEDMNPNGDLYTLHEFASIPQGDGTPFGNVLLAGKASDYGFVRIPSGHIGGHQLGMVMYNGTMRVARIPLKPVRDSARMSEWDTRDVADWVDAWNASMDEDDVMYAESTRDLGFVIGVDTDGRARLGWDCPLRRRAYYGGGVRGFGPSLPSSRRSHRLFREFNGDRHAHPTQKHGDASAQFGKYLTTNGFCFCPMSENVWPGMCSVKTELGDEHNCSLFSTVRAVKGEAWGWSHTFRPKTPQNEYKTCSVQLDWPFVAGKMRDGSTLLSTDVNDTVWNGASDVEARRCHVLDRIPDFAYAYVSKRELRPSGFTTLDRGVCHTGRVQDRVLHGTTTGRCIRASKGDTEAQIRCVGTTGASPKARRRTSRPASDAAYLTKHYRQTCSKCAKPPLFRTKSGHPMEPESSFGLPYRVSAERVLAQDLRDALCGQSADCLFHLNESAWKVGEFMRTYIGNPAGLFKPGFAVGDLKNGTAYYVPKTNQQPDDSSLWGKPWVYCPSKEALATGVNCTGSIKRPRWRKDKVHACYTTLEGALQGQPDPMAKTRVCELDGRLGNLCRVIREAQSLVASANCLASGSEACALQEFVYTPATWETTNQMFVHQTVEEYYKRIDGCSSQNESSCICGTDPSLSEFRKRNANTFEHCSAVPVVVFQRVLIAVRGMIVPVVKSASIALNIVVHLILTMVQSGNRDAVNQVLLDWAEIKRLMSGATSTISDLLFDLAFSTGVLGPWLKNSIMSACNTVNTVYSYVSNFWCTLVVSNLPGFLGALREIGGWIDVGFDTVNDVFGVILYDFLPDALMELYQYGYNRFFQSEKYKQKQKNYDDRVRLNVGNPDGQGKPMTSAERQAAAADRDNKLMKQLISAKKGSKQSTLSTIQSAFSIAGSLGGKYVGAAAGAADAAITAYQLYQEYEKAQKFAALLEKFPSSYTLFDFDSFYAAIDSMVTYLNSDITCYSMVNGLPPLQCNALSLAEPDTRSIISSSPRASSCWAEAQQRQVGVSTLYACSSTSTCCLDATSCDVESGMRMCGECPAVMAGVHTYGCNTMIQKCQCGVESFEVSRCVAQRDCGPASSCSLLASVDDMSFGAIKSCTGCTTSPICLYGSSQHYGECTCLSGANAKVDLCDSSVVGSPVSANPSRLCGFSSDLGTYFSWGELSLVGCVNAVSPVCVEVVTESGGSIYMPVASRLRSVQVSYGGRRRLLSAADGTPSARVRLPSVFSPEDPSEDLTPDVVNRLILESKWNHSSAPCGPLAHAYMQGHHLGVVDEATLHECVYWRIVARQITEDYSLTALENLDTFLLSPDDLAAAIGQQGVLEQLLKNPQALLVACMYSHWLKPVRAFLVASHGANASRLLGGWAKRITNKTAWKAISHRFKRWAVLQPLNQSTGNSSRRRLLGVWEETEQQVKVLPYFSSMSSITVFFVKNSSVGFKNAKSLLRDAYSWQYLPSQSFCRLLDPLFASSTQVLRVLQTYYAHFSDIGTNRNKNAAGSRLADIIPGIKFPAGFFNDTRTPGATQTGSVIFEWLLGVFGLTQGDIVNFLTQSCPNDDCVESNQWTFTYLAETLGHCDFESVMYCSRYKRDLLTSAVFAFLMYAVVTFIAGYVGLSGISNALFYALPLFILWLSTGVAPGCLPLIPTCLIDDVLATVKSWLPPTTSIPDILIAGNGSSLRSCTELSFTSWEDPIAFLACDSGFCDGMGDISFVGGSRWDFAQKRKFISSPDVGAYRLCATVSSIFVVPVVMAFSLGLAFASSVVLAFLALIPPTASLIWQVSVYNHQE